MILVVDDEPEIAEELADLISSTGRHVRFSFSALDALKLAIQLQPEIVITDMRMPEMDGAQLVRRIADTSEIPVRFIIVSGHLNVEADLTLMHDISYCLVPKPINIDALLDQIEIYDSMGKN